MDQVWSVAFSPDGQRIASSSQSRGVKVWEANTGRELLTLGTGAVFTVAFSPDSKMIVSGGAGQQPQLKFWDAETGEELLDLKAPTWTAAFSPDGNTLACTVTANGYRVELRPLAEVYTRASRARR